MIWTLTSGLTAFALTDGVDRTCRTLEELRSTLRQTTQVVTPSRAAWPVAFPDRASRALSFTLPVMFPPCATYELAFEQALQVPLECPRGGVLTGLLGGTLVTYSQAWMDSIEVTTLGVTNHFSFNLSAVNPSVSIPSPLALMDPRYVANFSTITGLVGGTAADLDSLVTADVLPGFQMDLFVAIGALNQLATFRLFEGTDATNTDPDAGPVIVRPLDYDGTTNAKVWMRLDA